MSAAGVCSVGPQPRDGEPPAPYPHEGHGDQAPGATGAAGQDRWAWPCGRHRVPLTVTLTSEAGQLGVTLSNPISRAWLRPQPGSPGRSLWLLAASTKATLPNVITGSLAFKVCCIHTYHSIITYLIPFIIGPLLKKTLFIRNGNILSLSGKITLRGYLYFSPAYSFMVN